MKVRLDIESLRAVMAVAQTGSVTQAARLLNLTQSAISHKLKRLEHKIGQPIFRRSDHGLRATEIGGRLLGYADRLVAMHDEAVAQLSPDNLTGSLRLGVTEDLATAGIARILSQFSSAYPNVKLVIRVAHSGTLAQWLTDGKIDLALMQLLDEQPQGRDRILWHDDVLWAQSEDFVAPDAGELPFITFHERCAYRLWGEAALAGTGWSLRLILECPSVEGVTNAVRSGLGLALIDRRNLRPGLIETPLGLPIPPQAVNVARMAARLPSSAVEALLDVVETEAGDRTLPRNERSLPW